MPVARHWEYSEVHWGVTGCSAPFCAEPAELLLDGDPLCIACADKVIERVEIVARYPGAREWLPDLFHEDEVFG